ncbi:hypothetical protein A3B45_01885 [Candidatus Daviesbacteria bacterium RIFCSPLOWO2_01_FULL_39_12]|uniref:General secretion pathway GspH domain-containing protein n=1 Tax=Candidatus Daviesbacteria bacterium RIFCSPLOWO2_01_FULL_39_12 TaxID=1797785 RepID=A0A1F5KMU9_9BACT|nr:MAG: hypothetical protein A3D79_00960 [Candidatus Daviesbacteria bacterium RIFCSPHIGHO2_02_FULL_39_8]OGE41951.1 MAG: hypothetical protein A3B45_01885 [Candidatus Daviesbacteria bacterium RIFCSPLOWO2_01_FULL_39_12]
MRERGYTLVELLVVIAIISLFGIGTLLQQNFSREDTALKKGAADLQSFIRLAQSNAQTATICQSGSSSAWTIEPGNTRTVVDLKCDISDSNPPLTQQSLNFDPNIEILSITGNSNCDTSYPLQMLDIRFPTLSGKPVFESPVNNVCVVSSTFLNINLRNTKTGNTSTVTVDKGGMIDVR